MSNCKKIIPESWVFYRNKGKRRVPEKAAMCLCGQAAGETEAEDCFSSRKQRATQVTEMSQNFSQLWWHSPIRAHESEGRRSKGNVRLSWATQDPVSKEKQPNTFLNQTKGRVRQVCFVILLWCPCTGVTVGVGMHSMEHVWISPTAGSGHHSSRQAVPACASFTRKWSPIKKNMGKVLSTKVLPLKFRLSQFWGKM